jgi:hypothetical protein
LTRLLTAEFRGSARERGRRHGELFAGPIRESGIIGFYLGYLERQLPEPRPAPLRLALELLHRRIAARQSPDVRELVRGFCEASGFPEEEVARGLAMPDALNLVVGLGGRVAEPLAAGCTSVAAWGDYSVDGRLRYARNLDFPGNGRWDQYPLVALHRPDEGLPYVSIGSAGSLVDGITGVNAEGLTVALHQHINSQVGWFGGRPILDLGEKVLRTARTIDEAASIAAGWRTMSGWTVVVTHAKRKEAAVIERTHRSCEVVRFTEGKLARANTYAAPGPASAELPYPCFRASSRVRAARADQRLEELKGKVDAAALASILSDHLDVERGRVRSFGQTIAQPHNVTSVVIEPEEGVMWVSEGRAPACDGSFRKISLWDLRVSEECLDKPNGLPAAMSRAYASYLDGFIAWLDRSDKRAAFAATADAARLDPSEPIYRFMNGLFALKLGAFETACDQLGAGAAMSDLPHRSCAQNLWRARALDLLGRRQESTRLYASLAFEPDLHPPLRRSAEDGLARPYRSSSLSLLMPDVTFADTYRY